MHLAIVHYHFNRGGVTQVVLNHLRGLNATTEDAGERLSVAIIYGGRREGLADEQLSALSNIDVTLHTIPGLDYDEGGPPQPAALAGDLREVLRQNNFAPGETLLHIHNHSLGKNVSLPGAIDILAGEGFRLLLQMHDFAEDLRPANYRKLSDELAAGGDPSAAIYPQAPHIHYAVLNGRDFGIMGAAGMDAARLHLLPNTVGQFDAMPARDAARDKLRQNLHVESQTKFVLYPVRGIRRKNVGEMLLLSAAAPADTVFAITLPPQNPLESASYGNWQSLAEELQLACVFDVGAPGGLKFTENLVAADLLMTTSIAEGFGMVFLETWLAGRALIGRDLPEITADFVASGIQLNRLYREFLIPIEWIGRDDLHGLITAAYGALLREYGVDTVSPQEISRQAKSLLAGEHIDFAFLNAAAQARVIRRVARDSAARDQLHSINPALMRSLTASENGEVIERNADVVRRTYSLEAGGRRLRDLYANIAACPTTSQPEALPQSDSILRAFLDIQRLHPVRWEP